MAFAFFRIFWPFPKFGRLIIITRNADARAVLSKPEIFAVPYGEEMRELGGEKATFVLGLEGAEQRCQHELIRRLIEPQDADWLVERTRQIADTLIDASQGRIDVMKDLITRVAAETCAEYFGLSIDDPDAFAEWSMAISALLFADPFGNPATRKLGLAGALRVRSVIDAAKERLSVAPPVPPEGLGKTILQRLVETGISDNEIRAIMVGMITGFIPTTTLAAGNIIEQLLWGGFDEAVAAARKASRGEEAARKRLEQLLFEAARLNPALNPGQWRHAVQDGTVPTRWGSHRIPAGSILLVATASAMRDDSSRNNELVFGSGAHACLGKTLAMAQITAIFESLLSREGVRASKGRWGRMFRVGVFPRRLDMEFKPAFGSQAQSMVTVLTPLAKEADLEAWQSAIHNLMKPGAPDLHSALRGTNIIHFASLNAVDLGDAAAPAPHLLLEINGDGDPDDLIDAIDASASPWLRPLFSAAESGEAVPKPTVGNGQSLRELLTARKIDLQARPWGTTGLCFYGLPGLSIASIRQQEELANFCRDAVDYFVTLHAGLGSHAAAALQFVRRLIHGDAELSRMGEKDAGKDIKKLIERGSAFRRSLMIPSRQEPPTICWKEPDSRLGAVLSSPTLFPLYGFLALAAVIVSVLCFYWFGFTLSLAWRDLPITAGQIAIALVSGGIGTATLAGIVVGAFAIKLRRAEATDKPEDFDPDLIKVGEVARRENDPGFAQNHFLSVSPLKPGPFRKFTLGMALWGIELVVSRAFRPGFIVNMGTIHFARWFRPSGSQRLVFLSNYDGSWESYLEDFITKAYPGQNAAWSNAVGFPRTNWLIYDGAQDGDRFKRWVRRQQQPTQFWFNHFPHLTADQMRDNAVISWELARATTDSQARAWLSYFGSMPRTDTVIETQEVQALVFRGFKRLPFMKFAAISLPADRAVCRDWLKSLANGRNPHELRTLETEDRLLEITFGDRPLFGEDERSATCVAFTAAGFSHLGFPEGDEPGTMATFPTVFNLGMSSRQRILGDYSESDPLKWRWSDVASEKPIHVALFVYGKSKAECDKLLGLHRAKLTGASFIVHELDTQPTDKGIDYEHFGFRDGISQPVIRGTERFARGAQPRDIMAPGEFILGYKSNQGYFPPTPVVTRKSDVRNHLASVPTPAESRFSAFQDPRPQVRDFGRNGTFLAIRQFEQHVDAFHEYAKRAAKKLTDDLVDEARVPNLIGGALTSDWIEAKMMGRWQDGVPLIDRPIWMTPAEHAAELSTCEVGREHAHAKHPHRKSRMRTDTDLDFGVNDPQGLHCPFGAHIRRANPRGSLAPGDDSQLAITNRHRLLRRGRPYKKGDEKGLLFVGLCADLERQFEFIQQSWIGAAGFAGLTNEPDPIVSVKPTAASTRFTIPTSAGSLALEGGESFVTVRGGGYFFLPSRSALLFLAELK
ncbi:cytochrome [Bradyrhizobium archetypum]|uniref:cytochrome n=1 Tax=Bradyrhizobium archetypum TaxID=2721160 RepID=UPI002898D860|nr:cytochrome [Bradyrhizobium archetypum]